MPAPGGTVSRWRVRIGYPVALVALWLARPTPRALAFGAGVALLGLLLRGAAAGHLRKHEALATSGPYGLTRNPLYLGSALVAAGFLAASRSWLAAALVVAYFAAFYPGVMKREEQELRARYGDPFEEYARRVPLFLPRLAPFRPGGPRFSWTLYRRNREYEAALGLVAVVALLWLKMQFSR